MRVLLVDDDEDARQLIRRLLSRSNLHAEVMEADDLDVARGLGLGPVHAVLIDHQLRGKTGAELLPELRVLWPDAAIIMVTAHGDERLAVDVMKAGAADYLSKGDLTPERLEHTLRYAVMLRAAEMAMIRADEDRRRYAQRLRALVEAAPSLHASFSLRELLESAARTACEVLQADRAVARVQPAGVGALLEAAVNGPGNRDLSEGQGDGGPRSVRTSSAPTPLPLPPRTLTVELTSPSAPGTVLGTLEVTEGATQFVEAHEALLQSLAHMVSVAVENAREHRQATEAVAARDDTMAIVSHDLRVPLGNVALGVGLLKTLVGDHREAGPVLDRIERGVTSMARLIDDLLEVARMDAGKLTVDLKKESVAAILEGAAAMAGPLAEAAKVAFQVRSPLSLPAVVADRERLLQVIGNLVSNALKFTPAGGLVQLVAEEVGDTQPTGVRVSVIDTGPGIPPDEIGHVFDRFWQREGREHGGVGLGLHIASRIAQAHHTRLEVESSPGAGATFSFVLPVASP